MNVNVNIQLAGIFNHTRIIGAALEGIRQVINVICKVNNRVS